MITENLSTLKIHKLTKAQYDRELEAGRIDENALYLTPDEDIDLSHLATKEELPTTISQLINDSGYITEYTETDPTVPPWAKKATKPTYTADEVGAIPTPFIAAVGQTIVVKAIDENGKPTEWEAVDIPKENIYIQPEEPLDAPDGSLWIDMDAEGGISSGASGGVCLPPVTEADNGKVLTVVNGVWVAVALPNAEEASF